MNKQKNSHASIWWLLGFISLCFTIAFLGSVTTKQGLTPWYAQLHKASWNPPAWVFPPVWTVLYTMIAISGWMIFKAHKSRKRDKAMRLYFAQLFFNGLWSLVFFYFQQPVLALLDLSLILFFLGLTLQATWPVSKNATWLLVPYAIWSVYAFSLNGAIVYFLK